MDIDALTEDLTVAGLTRDQAEVYVRLLQTGPTKVNNLMPFLDTSRSTVYRLLDDLVEAGVVSKSLESPTVYEAVDPPVLFERTEQQIESSLDALNDVRERWGETLESIQTRSDAGAEHHWEKLEGPDPIYGRLERLIESAEESIEVVSTHQATSGQRRPQLEEAWKTFYQRMESTDLACRLLIDLEGATHTELLHRANALEGVELRDFRSERTVQFVLVDERQVLMWVYPAPLGDVGRREDVAVWTDAPGSVFVHEMLFEELWPKGKPVPEGKSKKR